MAGPGQKSSFAQTCTLLSHFMKERANTFEAKSIETLSLLPTMEYSHSSQKPNQLDLSRNSCALDPAVGGAQMTVFYGGKVIVFDDLPAEQAKTIMDLASKSSSSKDSSPQVLMNDRTVGKDYDRAQNNKQQIHQLPPTGSDVQIARKSLHRFFAKRKERIAAAKAPYQANNPSASVPLNSEDRNWEFAVKGKSSGQLDLNK